jgi:hypothetical protein
MFREADRAISVRDARLRMPLPARYSKQRRQADFAPTPYDRLISTLMTAQQRMQAERQTTALGLLSVVGLEACAGGLGCEIDGHTFRPFFLTMQR